MRWRFAIFGTLGTVATLVGAAFVLAPELFRSLPGIEQLVTQLAGTDPTAVMLAATLLVGLYVAIAARSSTSDQPVRRPGDAERQFDHAITDPPEMVTADQRTVTAADLDADIDAAIENGGERLHLVRQLLVALVTESYADHHGVTPEAAREAVATGTWTDNRVAAAFLGGEDGPNSSLLARIRLWLTPERERQRRIERTLAALRTVAEAEP